MDGFRDHVGAKGPAAGAAPKTHPDGRESRHAAGSGGMPDGGACATTESADGATGDGGPLPVPTIPAPRAV